MYTVVTAIDSELQTWEKETKEEVATLVRQLIEEGINGGNDVMVFPCSKSKLRVSTEIELD